MERKDLPLVLGAKHVTNILGLSKSATYELFKQPDFPLLEVNGRKLVYRDSFFNWLDYQERENCRKQSR